MSNRRLIHEFSLFFFQYTSISTAMKYQGNYWVPKDTRWYVLQAIHVNSSSWIDLSLYEVSLTLTSVTTNAAYFIWFLVYFLKEHTFFSLQRTNILYSENNDEWGITRMVPFYGDSQTWYHQRHKLNFISLVTLISCVTFVSQWITVLSTNMVRNLHT